MSLRCDEQIKRIMSHRHVGKISVCFERERRQNWETGKHELIVMAYATVWCTHHHAPLGFHAPDIETALARVENWLDSQDSDNWRGISCSGETFRRIIFVGSFPTKTFAKDDP